MKRDKRWESEVAALQRHLMATAELIGVALDAGAAVVELRAEFDALMRDYNAMHGAGGPSIREVRARLLARGEGGRHG